MADAVVDAQVVVREVPGPVGEMPSTSSVVMVSSTIAAPAPIGAVHAHVDVAVLLDDRAVGSTGRPSRMLLVQGAAHLREVRARDDLDPGLVARGDDRREVVAQEVAAGVWNSSAVG